MDLNQAKKQFYDDRTQVLSIINKKTFDSNYTEDALKAFLKRIEATDAKPLDYESIKDLANLYKIKLNINSLIEKDLNAAVEVWELYKNKSFNDREETFDSIFSDSVRFIEQRLIEKLKKLWNKVVNTTNSSVIIFEKIYFDYNEYRADEVFNNLQKFPDFQGHLEVLAKRISVILSQSAEFLVKYEVTTHNSKLFISEENKIDSLSQNFDSIFAFLQHKLIQIAKNSQIFIKVLDFSEVFNKVPEDFRVGLKEAIEKNGFRLKLSTSPSTSESFTNTLQEIRELALHDDLQLTTVIENQIPGSVISLYAKLGLEVPAKNKISFTQIRVPNSVLRFVEILYTILSPNSGEEELIRRFPQLRLCIQLYLTIRATAIQKKSQINRFCMFFNSCKFLEYHFVMINSNILNKLDSSVNQSMNLSDFVYKTQQKIAKCFRKLQKKFEKQVVSDFQRCIEKQKMNVMKMNEKLAKHEDYLKDISEILSQEDSYKIIGRLLDFIILSLKTAFSHMNAEYSHLRPLILTISSFSRFFPKGLEAYYAKQWNVLSELDSTKHLFN